MSDELTAEECYANARKAQGVGATILAMYWAEQGKQLEMKAKETQNDGGNSSG